MSNLKSLISILVIVATIFVMPVLAADTEWVFYNGYAFHPELVPSGMIPFEGGWSHGSLFSAPEWLLDQIDQNLMSTVLDRGVTPAPTPAVSLEEFENFISNGFAALEGGNYQAAYKAFQAAIELKPGSPDAWYGLGITLESQKRFLSALDAYTRSASFAKGSSTDWASFAGKGRVLFNLNRFAEAKAALETAVTRYENARIMQPEKLEEIIRLLEEINQKNQVQSPVIFSAYIPPVVTGV
jgi:tetratricopeptide (TPR) repeat protein